MLKAAAEVRVSCYHMIVQKWRGFLLLPLLRRRVQIQAQEGLGSSWSSPDREGRGQIEHLGSHAIIDGGSGRCSSRHRRRGFGLSLGGRGFLAFRTHHVIGYVPAGQRGRVRLELGTSRVVGEQGERDKARISAGHTNTRLRTLWKRVDGRWKMREYAWERERREREIPQPPVSSVYLNLFITILIGLKLPTFLYYYVWTEGHIPFRCFTGIVHTGKTPYGSTLARQWDLRWSVC